MDIPYNIVAMGDVNLDWYAKGTLSFPFRDLVVNGVIEWRQVDELPGGSGLNFAHFAQQMGYKVLLLGKLGKDPAGRFLYEWLQQHHLEAGVSFDESLGTGKAFIARDQQGIRFLVNNVSNANRMLSLSDIEQNAVDIASSQVLYVSGYCVMEPSSPQARATQRALQIARTNPHCTIVFDVVPHQIYRIYQFPQFRDLVSGVDILISEVATMRRYLNLGNPQEQITRELAEETVQRCSSIFDRFILRFGLSGCDEQVIWNANERAMFWEATGHATAADTRGFGDRLTIRALRDVFKIL